MARVVPRSVERQLARPHRFWWKDRAPRREYPEAIGSWWRGQTDPIVSAVLDMYGVAPDPVRHHVVPFNWLIQHYKTRARQPDADEFRAEEKVNQLVSSVASEEPTERTVDWKTAASHWGLGMVTVVKGTWQWTPRPTSGLVPNSRRLGEPQRPPAVTLIERRPDGMEIAGGSAFSGARVVLFQPDQDGIEYAVIDETLLSEEGWGEIMLAGDGLSLSLVVLPPG